MFYSRIEHIATYAVLNELFHELSLVFFCLFDNHNVSRYAWELMELLIFFQSCIFHHVFEGVEGSIFCLLFCSRMMNTGRPSEMC